MTMVYSALNANGRQVNMMKLGKWAVLLTVTVALSGCVSLTLSKKQHQQFRVQSPKTAQQRLSKLQRFTADGAFSIQENGKKPVLANYQWTQKTIRFYRIRIFSPLNLFSMTILGHLGSVTLWKSTKQHVTASTPEQLLKREMGWNLPIRNLFYWIRGAIAPGKRQVTFNQFGHVATLQQSGWSIKYSHYTMVDGYDLPQKLLLSRPGIRVTLVIKRWLLTHKTGR